MIIYSRVKAGKNHKYTANNSIGDYLNLSLAGSLSKTQYSLDEIDIVLTESNLTHTLTPKRSGLIIYYIVLGL